MKFFCKIIKIYGAISNHSGIDFDEVATCFNFLFLVYIMAKGCLRERIKLK